MRAIVSGAAGLAFAVVFKAIKAVPPERPIQPARVALDGTIENRITTDASPADMLLASTSWPGRTPSARPTATQTEGRSVR